MIIHYVPLFFFLIVFAHFSLVSSVVSLIRSGGWQALCGGVESDVEEISMPASHNLVPISPTKLSSPRTASALFIYNHPLLRSSFVSAFELLG
jgi:hypothetical protein